MMRHVSDDALQIKHQKDDSEQSYNCGPLSHWPLWRGALVHWSGTTKFGTALPVFSEILPFYGDSGGAISNIICATDLGV